MKAEAEVVPVTPVREQLLALLFQHRAADTDQLHALLGRDRFLQYMRRCLRELRSDGLVESWDEARHLSVWTLTQQGHRRVAGWPEFSSRPERRWTPREDLRRAHTLTVTRTAVTFVDDARRRGDGCSGLDWLPKVSHTFEDGVRDGERRIVAAALLHYERAEPQRQLLRAFVEVDRATMASERLAGKTIAYARLHSALPAEHRGGGGQRIPTWQRSYTVFPRLLFVLTGAGPRAMRQRIADLQAMVAHHPLVEGFAAEVPVGAAVLEELEEEGPSAAVWTPLNGGGKRRSWMDL